MAWAQKGLSPDNGSGGWWGPQDGLQGIPEALDAVFPAWTRAVVSLLHHQRIMAITGLSMAARALRVTHSAEAQNVLARRPLKSADAKPQAMPMPQPEEVAPFRAVPELTSVLDCTQGFGHTDLVWR